jgi:hypothetical protein
VCVCVFVCVCVCDALFGILGLERTREPSSRWTERLEASADSPPAPAAPAYAPPPSSPPYEYEMGDAECEI